MKSNSEIDNYLNEMNFTRQRTLKSIFNKYYRPLCQYAHKFIPQDEQVIKDLITEVFIGLIDELIKFNSEDEIKNYLYETTNKRCIDFLEMKPDDNKDTIELLVNAPENEEVVIEAELMKLINEEIKKLPSQRKRILQQLFWEGLSSKQVAVKMQLSQQTVRNQKMRAILSLRKTMLKKIL